MTGEATERDLKRLHGLSAAMAIVLVIPAGVAAIALISLSLIIGRAYSLPPMRLSYRTYLAPVVLGVAYVLVPYALGVGASGTSWWPRDALFAAALYLLFAARIVLKDFRDREGDARYGRPTLLLRAGKVATCSVSLVALLSGDLLLLLALRPPIWLGLLVQVFAVAILSRLWALGLTAERRAEQVAIGLGARLGNGVLLVVLTWLVVNGQGTDPASELLLTTMLGGLFLGSFALLANRPEQILIAYKG